MAPIGTEPCEQRPCCAEIWHLFKVAFQFFRTHTHCWHTRTFHLRDVASQKKQSWQKYSVPLRECQLWIEARSILTCAIFLKMEQPRPRLLLDSWILIYAEPRFSIKRTQYSSEIASICLKKDRVSLYIWALLTHINNQVYIALL